VLANLALAFPEKTLEERKTIAKKFYRNFTDNFIEAIKLLSISKSELQKRFICDFTTMNKLYPTGRNVQFHLGHFFNWEYANLLFGFNSLYPALTVYKPINNKSVDRLFARLRTRFGAKLISSRNFLREFKPYLKQRFALVFVADQSLGSTRTAYWLPFFGKLTPFVTGPEKNAKLNNPIVFYVKFGKIKRGFYKVEFTEISNDPRSLPEGDITKKMISLLEDNIRENPENYLWSHRRWKHTYDPAKHRAL
jgi:KDO2-lipid IV(A) lauroyltransferase